MCLYIPFVLEDGRKEGREAKACVPLGTVYRKNAAGGL